MPVVDGVSAVKVGAVDGTTGATGVDASLVAPPSAVSAVTLKE